MNSKNPNVVLLMKEKIDIDKFANNMKETWNYECKFEKEEQEKFISYFFKLGSITFALSVFDTAFPEDINEDIGNSKYALKSQEIYEIHTKFCIVSVVGEADENLNMTYASFTRVIMSLLLSLKSNQCFVYDIRSRQAIDKEMYLKMFNNMKSWYENHKEIFPIDWYVNYVMYKNEGKLNALTLGFEAFNDYEIEIHDKEISAEQLNKIIRYIVTNVIGREDKIKNRDLIPIPLGEDYDEAGVKQGASKDQNKETLEIIF